MVAASAVAAVLFREPRRSEVLGRLEGRRLSVPDLLRYEVANVAWKKVRRQPELQAAVAAALDRFRAVAITCAAVPPGAAFGLV